MEAEGFSAAVLTKLDKEHSDTDAFKKFCLPRMEDALLVGEVSPSIKVPSKHLPSVVDLDCAVCFLGESSNDEVTHSEEQLFVTADLFMIGPPRRHNRLQP